MGQEVRLSGANAFQSNILAVGIGGFAVWCVVGCVVQIVVFICGFGV